MKSRLSATSSSILLVDRGLFIAVSFLAAIIALVRTIQVIRYPNA
jgi:hypothetical protein